MTRYPPGPCVHLTSWITRRRENAGPRLSFPSCLELPASERRDHGSLVRVNTMNDAFRPRALSKNCGVRITPAEVPPAILPPRGPSEPYRSLTSTDLTR